MAIVVVVLSGARSGILVPKKHDETAESISSHNLIALPSLAVVQQLSCTITITIIVTLITHSSSISMIHSPSSTLPNSSPPQFLHSSPTIPLTSSLFLHTSPETRNQNHLIHLLSIPLSKAPPSITWKPEFLSLGGSGSDGALIEMEVMG
jgi:hypothetical protein